MNGRLGPITVAWAALCLTGVSAAAPYRPPIVPEPQGKPVAWIAKRSQGMSWCAFGSLKRVQAAIASGAYDAGGLTAIWLRDGRLDGIRIQNESEDAFADDVYRFDQKRRLVRL